MYLYCMCVEPEETWDGWLWDVLSDYGWDSRWKWIQRVSFCQDELRFRYLGETD